jgi:hypothetical protein
LQARESKPVFRGYEPRGSERETYMNSAENILRRFGYFADSVIEKMLLQLCPGGKYEITMEISTIDDYKEYARKKISLTFDEVSEFRLFDSRTQLFNLGLGVSYARLGEDIFSICMTVRLQQLKRFNDRTSIFALAD